MKVIVLGGAGLQGKAAIQDLSKQADIKQIICADVDFSGLDEIKEHVNWNKISKKTVDATSVESIDELYAGGADVVINLLPKPFHELVTDRAIEARLPVVNSSYSDVLSDEIKQKAKDMGVTIVPEAGLDPGIDLVLCGYGVNKLDKVTELYSYCGGVPEKSAANNPLQYKITWNMESVLMSYMRPAKIKKDGKIIDIPAEEQHAEKWITQMSMNKFDGLELIPNGDALQFAELLGIEDEVVNIERKTIRWEGHSELWRTLISLGLLSEENVSGLDCDVNPRQFLARHLEPSLKYESEEKDLVLMKNIIRGEKDGQKTEIIFELVDERDLETGLFAMNRTVGYTASIVAKMLLDGEIKGTGILSPIRDIPYKKFIEEIQKRNIHVKETIRAI